MAQPLQKTRENGTLYTRVAEIEAGIDAALGQDLKTLCGRARIRDRRDGNYLPSECLVHLIRGARRRGDEVAPNKLLPLLLERCSAVLNTKVDSDIPNAPRLREDILGDFAELFAKDGTSHDENLELDFFEVRFNLAFRAFRITRVRAELKRLNLTRALPDPDLPDDQIDDEVLGRLSDVHAATSDTTQLRFRNEVLAAIKLLPPDERDALVLCRFMRLKEESEDPLERTAASVCNVTGRTIRNRLSRALATLSRLLKENAS